MICAWCAEIEGGAAKAAYQAQAAQWRRGGPPTRVPAAWRPAPVQVEPEPQPNGQDDHVLRFDGDAFAAALAAAMGSRGYASADVADATGVDAAAVRRAMAGSAPSADDVIRLLYWLKQPDLLRFAAAMPRGPAAAPAESDADAITRPVAAPLPPGGREAK